MQHIARWKADESPASRWPDAYSLAHFHRGLLRMGRLCICAQASVHGSSTGGTRASPMTPASAAAAAGQRLKPAWAEVLTGGAQLRRTASKGSQALQMARSLGQAGTYIDLPIHCAVALIFP